MINNLVMNYLSQVLTLLLNIINNKILLLVDRMISLLDFIIAKIYKCCSKNKMLILKKYSKSKWQMIN